MLKICSDLFSYWNDNIRYVHWKSNEHIAEGLSGKTDLDVFVLPDDKDACERSLKSFSFIRCYVPKSNSYPNVEEWLGLDFETGKMIHIHLHYCIITGTKFCKEYTFPLKKRIIETRVFSPEYGLYMISPEIEMVFLFSRIVLKASNKYRITGNQYQAEIDYLRQRVNSDKLLETCKELIKNEWHAFYILINKESLNRKDWLMLLRIVRNWLDPYRTSSRIKCWFRTRYYWIKYYCIRFLNRYFDLCLIDKKTISKQGFSVCFIGQDGSGKSTVGKSISNWLGWKLSNHQFYLGSGENYKSISKRIISSVGRIRFKKVSDGVESHNHVAPNNNIDKGIKQIIRSVIGSYLLYKNARHAMHIIKTAQIYIQNGGIAIYDRFPQNMFNGIYDGPKIRSKYIEKGCDNIIVRFFSQKEENIINEIQKYQPSLVFKLLLPWEESMRRKPHENLDQVKRKNEITEKLVFPNSVVYNIDAMMDYEKELVLIKQRIWSYLVKVQ